MKARHARREVRKVRATRLYDRWERYRRRVVNRLLQHQRNQTPIEVVFRSIHRWPPTVGFDGDTLSVGVHRKAPRGYRWVEGITYIARTDPERTGVAFSPFASEKISGGKRRGDPDSAFELDTKSMFQPRRRLRQVLSRPEAYVVVESRPNGASL